MHQEKLTIELNNDMTRVIEKIGDEYLTYTVVGTGDDIEWDYLITDKIPISAEELLNFTRSPSAREIYEQEQFKYTVEDVSNVAEEMGIDLEVYDCEKIAGIYLEKQDSNLAYNDQIKNIINNYLSYDNCLSYEK